MSAQKLARFSCISWMFKFMGCSCSMKTGWLITYWAQLFIALWSESLYKEDYGGILDL